MASGLTILPPKNGIFSAVQSPVTFSAVAWTTCCCRRAAGEVRLRRVELVLADARVDQRALPVHVLPAFLEAPALPGTRTGRRSRRAVEAVGEDRLRHVDLDPADGVDQLLELGEVDEGDVVDSRPVSALIVFSASVGPPNWNAALILPAP